VHFISTPKKDNFTKINFECKILFKISQNSFSSCISCHFAGAFVRLTGSGMGCQIGQNALAITYLQKKNYFYSTKEYDN
jgi:hypothetical protein